MEQRAYSLCDVDIDILTDLSELEALIDQFESKGIDIVYVGSHLCSEFFINWWRAAGKKTLELIRTKGKKCVLCVPIPSENRLEEVYKVIKEAARADKSITVSVNDYGMLNWAISKTKCDLMLGRMFMRNERDPRFVQLGKENVRIPFSVDTIRSLYDEGNGRVKGIEMEGYGASIYAGELPEGMILALHTPWIQMSCDRICTDASLASPLEEKYRPDSECGMECCGVLRKYDIPVAQSSTDNWRSLSRNEEGIRETYVVKKGRGIYFYCDRLPEIRGIDKITLRLVEKEF